MSLLWFRVFRRYDVALLQKSDVESNAPRSIWNVMFCGIDISMIDRERGLGVPI